MFKYRKLLLKQALLATIFNLVFPSIAFSEGPLVIDNSSLSQVTDNKLFVNYLNVKQEFQMSLGLDSRIKYSVDLESNDSAQEHNFSSSPTFATIPNRKVNQGFRVKRLNTTWQSKSGILTVGRDWANFQNFLDADKKQQSLLRDDRTIASQVKWISPNGFSVSLEGKSIDSLLGYTPSTKDTTSNPYTSLILSWKGSPDGLPGRYRISLQGQKFNADGDDQNFRMGSKQTNWGVNVEGGWQIGDLFAALSVTYGHGVDSYLLRRYGNDLLVTPNQNMVKKLEKPLDVRPSLYYQLNDTSNIYVVLGRYTTDNNSSPGIIDTLDTVNMSYNWSPWPNTNIEVELIGKNASGSIGSNTDNQIRFGAKTRF